MRTLPVPMLHSTLSFQTDAARPHDSSAVCLSCNAVHASEALHSFGIDRIHSFTTAVQIPDAPFPPARLAAPHPLKRLKQPPHRITP